MGNNICVECGGLSLSRATFRGQYVCSECINNSVTLEKLKIESLLEENNKLKAIFELVANALIQIDQAEEDNLPAKAESFRQEALKAMLEFIPKDSEGKLSDLASKLRFKIWTNKYE